ncbi:GGDEF domain-containing protein [Acuticoccus sp. I52.16.1]|uniref:GGDEF domain-containing protein n=1 Tax=Acuticoccus sp. I52.16.1 TaxID=2928472 RepID=UPI001FD2936C|nr:GGDEF domain-containing protein [Acuticoccus sp. I52.16.1]UOM37332.1 GGDEF domain-containing protein [Acuticoccus sp. I52.16.1]
MSDGSHVVRAMSTPYPAVLTGLELGTYRHVAALAQRLFDVPLAAVVLSDGQRWSAARAGLAPGWGAHALAACRACCTAGETLRLADAAADARFAVAAADPADPADPVGEGPVRGCLATPIRLSDGAPAGMLCALDARPRGFDAADLAALEDLARCVGRELELRLLCATDPLTGVLTRDAFLQALERGIAEESAVALAVMDLDSFKAINDTFGHLGGDKVLAGTGTLMRRELCGVPVQLGRLGGEEFGFLFADMTIGEVIGELHSLRQSLSGYAFEGIGGVRITASFGLTAIEPAKARHEHLQLADLALYKAKHLGRNRLEQASPQDVGGASIHLLARRHRDGAGRVGTSVDR